ncbi:MAG: helix-turn-helix domain-containing protein [bacterium]|nr:helix-turn-helix domain-containing protein [bacterium]
MLVHNFFKHMVNYGKKIKEYRKEKNLSQAELAEKTQMGQTSISAWEKSAYPPLEFIEKSLEVLKPELLLWEFFIEDLNQLNNYIPSWIKPDQLEFLKKFNSLPVEKQKHLLKVFNDIIETP